MPDTISVHYDFFTLQFEFKLCLTLAALQKIGWGPKDLEVIIQICQMGTRFETLDVLDIVEHVWDDSDTILIILETSKPISIRYLFCTCLMRFQSIAIFLQHNWILSHT